MKKLYQRSRQGYPPSLTQTILQQIRCMKRNHIFIVSDIVENGNVIGEYKVCEHCGHNIHSYNV